MNQDSKSESSLKQRRQLATREAILAAAEAQLAERGLHGTRMEDVAARAGVSVGTIYNHVGDRHALLSELLGSRRLELVSKIDDLLGSVVGRSFEEQLAAFVRVLFDHFESHRPLFRVLVQEDARSPTASRRSLHTSLVERAAALMERGVEAGTLPRNEATLYSVLLVGLVRGVLVHTLHADTGPDIAAEQVVSFFLAGAGVP